MIGSPPAATPAALGDSPVRTLVNAGVPYLVITAVALVAHGLLLLNDGTYWDDWLLLDFLSTPDAKPLLHDMYVQGGFPMTAYLVEALATAGLMAHFRAVTFLTLCVSAYLAYWIVVNTGLFNKALSLGFAIFFLIYPAFQAYVVAINLPSLIYFCTFLIGIALFLKMRACKSTRRQVALRLFALGALYIGFMVNSLLVFFYPLFIAVAWRKIEDTRTTSVLHHLWHTVYRHLDFISLPLIYWGVKKIYFPAHGYYENYNAIRLSLLANIKQTQANLTVTFIDQPLAALSLLDEYPLTWAIVTAFALLFSRRYILARFNGPEAADLGQLTPSAARATMVVAFALAIASAAPYALVGLTPSMTGWNTRHSLLASIPGPLMIVTVSALALNKWRPQTKHVSALIRTLLVSVIASMFTAFSLACLNFHMAWQARAVKDRAIVADLHQVPLLKKYSTFWIDDRYPLGGEPFYRFYEWSGMFKRAWGGESRIGLQVQAYPPSPATLTSLRPFYTRYYSLSQYDPTGCPVVLIILPGQQAMTQYTLVYRYLAHRFLTPESLPEFLTSVVHLHVQPATDDSRCAL